MSNVVALRPRALGLWGLSGSGKSAVADELEATGWATVHSGMKIADFVLQGEGLDKLLGLTERPLTVEEYEYLKGKLPGFHQKLVTYGNAVRELLGVDAWAGAIKLDIERLMQTGFPVAWANVRTEADYRALRAVGGKLVRVHRGTGTRVFSELDVEIMDDSTYPANYHLINDGTLDGLSAKVDEMLEALWPTTTAAAGTGTTQ